MGQHLLRYDVVVVGGGAAGLAAALGAAGAGARTALVERYGFLGGMATAGMVSTICGLYQTSPEGTPEPVNEGFALTFARRLAEMPGCEKPVRRGRMFVMPYTPFAFSCLADELTSAAPALDVYLHAYLVDVTTRAARVESVRVATWERTSAMRSSSPGTRARIAGGASRWNRSRSARLSTKRRSICSARPRL